MRQLGHFASWFPLSSISLVVAYKDDADRNVQQAYEGAAKWLMVGSRRAVHLPDASGDRWTGAGKDHLIRSKPEGIGIMVLMRDPPDLEGWLAWHTAAGVRRFFLGFDRSNENLILQRLASLPAYLAVRVAAPLFLDSSDHSSEKTNASWQEDGRAFFITNYRLADWALTAAHQDGVGAAAPLKWLVHIDADELLLARPDAAAVGTPPSMHVNDGALLPGDLATVMDYDAKLERDGFACAHFKNWEALPSARVESDSRYFEGASQFVDCALGNGCIAYQNGKSAAGVGASGAHFETLGPHYFHRTGQGYSSMDPSTSAMQVAGIVVLHFESISFEAWRKKFSHISHIEPWMQTMPYYLRSIAKLEACSRFESSKSKDCSDDDLHAFYATWRDRRKWPVTEEGLVDNYKSWNLRLNWQRVRNAVLL